MNNATLSECESATSTIFDLESKNVEILGAKSQIDFKSNYYNSQADAELAINPLTSPYLSTTSSQLLF